MAENRENNVTRDDVLILDKRKLSLISSALILMFFFVFVAGYFWGKRSSVSQIVSHATYSSFADQAYGASLIHGQSSCEDAQDESENSLASAKQQPSQEQENRVGETKNLNEDMPKTKELEKKFIGQIAGFSTKRTAQNLVDRLATKKISVKLISRESRSSAGNCVTWYQVVTERYPEKEQLQEMISQIKRFEKIKGVRIIELNNAS